MTALTTRDALADALALHDAYRVNKDGWTVCICGHVAVNDDDDGSHARHVSDALIASGAVIDAAALAYEKAAHAANVYIVEMGRGATELHAMRRALAATLSGRDA